jgi:N-acylneuraminate cytidylyltransferase/CMP-N,N'-diacetyllegionaminic acid synthase
MLAGKPLLSYSIEQAKLSGIFDEIAVSSDSDELLEAARSAGATVLIKRPIELAQDTSAKLPAIRHCVESTENQLSKKFEILVDLDATSPLREVEDIINCVNLIQSDSSIENIITATPARRSPYFNLVELDEHGCVSVSKKPAGTITRRQDAPKCFDMNASIYVWRRSTLFNHDSIFLPTTRLYEMPEDRSIDIDSELDFEIVSMLMQKKLQGKI